MDTLKINHFFTYRYSLGLKRAFKVGGKDVSSRDGIIIQIVSDQGHMGFGDCVPLPGLSQEDLKKAAFQVEKLKNVLTGDACPLELSALLSYLKNISIGEEICSSVRFAFESALVMLAADYHGKTMGEFLGATALKPILSAALLQGSLKEVVAEASHWKSHGQKVFKLKIGNRNIPLDVQKLNRLRDLLGPQVTFRLDVNGAWTMREALMFAKSSGKHQIDFWEEPIKDVKEWRELFQKTDIPIAVDQNLGSLTEDDLNVFPGLKVLIIKPTVCGGITGFMAAHALAKQYSRRIILSSTFESGIGLTCLANLALLTLETIGAGTSSWMKADMLSEGLISDSGMILPQKLKLKSENFHKSFQNKLKVS